MCVGPNSDEDLFSLSNVRSAKLEPLSSILPRAEFDLFDQLLSIPVFINSAIDRFDSLDGVSVA